MNDNMLTEPTTETNDHSPKERRAWLKDNGFVIGDRGRLSAEHNKAYDEAHGLV